MEQYQVTSLAGQKPKKKQITVSVPGSKSMTNRALLLATLADGESKLNGVLFSDDSRYFMKCVQELGIPAVIDEERKQITLTGSKSALPKKEASLYVGSAGTAARFLTALLGITPGHWELSASEQMKKRPMAPLLCGLQELGTHITFHEKENCFPFALETTGVERQEISINIDDSSQFLSALLIACCRTGKDFTIHVEGSHGMAYIDMTTRMMEEFGVVAQKQETDGHISYLVSGSQHYTAREYQIESDLSAACYFYAMAMLLGIEVTVEHVKEDTLQGDINLLYVFEQMGGKIRKTESGIALQGPENGVLHGVTVDMHSFSDQAITLAAVAPFADSPTTITGIGHIRYQESNRIQAIVTELTRLGIRCEELADGVKIYPGTVQAAAVHTYDDHRMAMGFSLLGLRVPGIVINDPMCCKKTFENYFDVLDAVIKELK